MGPTTLFTHLKIISLQCFQFQFSVSAKISSIQTHPVYPWHDYYSTNINRDRVKNYTKGDESMNQFFFFKWKSKLPFIWYKQNINKWKYIKELFLNILQCKVNSLIVNWDNCCSNFANLYIFSFSLSLSLKCVMK